MVERADDRDVVDQGFEREDPRHDPCIAASLRGDRRARTTSPVMDRSRTVRRVPVRPRRRPVSRAPSRFRSPRRRSLACERWASAWRSSRTTRLGPRRPSLRRLGGRRNPGRVDEVETSALATAELLAAARRRRRRSSSARRASCERCRARGIAVVNGDATRGRGRRRGMGSRMPTTTKLRMASLLVAARRVLGGDERRRVVPGTRRKLARGRGAPLRHRNHDRGACRGRRQAAGARSCAPRSNAPAVERRSSIGDRLETDIAGARPRVGFAPRPHRYRQRRRRRGIPDRADVRRPTISRALFAPPLALRRPDPEVPGS